MAKRCPHCNERIIDYPISKIPLWEDTPFKSRFNWVALNPRYIRWKNLVVGNPLHLFWIITVLFLAWSYSHDTEACFSVYENPCGFVMKNYQACYIANQSLENLVNINPDTLLIETKINTSLP